MIIRDRKSIIVIFVYAICNLFIIVASFSLKPDATEVANAAKSIAPEFTEIMNLDYFHLKGGIPQMSLSADKMRSQGEEFAEFDIPKGVYNFQKKDKTIVYDAVKGTYKKAKDVLILEGEVHIESDEAKYSADKVKYFLKKDLIIGNGNIVFEGEDLKSRDYVHVTADTMRAQPEAKISTFKSNVKGQMQRKKKYEGKLTFSSDILKMDGNKSLAELQENVHLHRDTYDITAGKADIYLENYNKSLKYFILNDDVKVTEKLETPQGVQVRKSFSERLEGFGREQKMVLSGAPRVEMDKDVVKGYRITIRENTELIEVDDAMSDVQVKRKKLKD